MRDVIKYECNNSAIKRKVRNVDFNFESGSASHRSLKCQEGGCREVIIIIFKTVKNQLS
jgi:hypothetical protein